MLEGLIGQERPKEILGAGVESGRLPQTLVFVGPKGVGKKTAARMLANFLHGSGQVNHPDTFWFSEILEAIREADEKSPFQVALDRLMKFVSMSPALSQKKVAIIDSADEIPEGAQNSLLKTLEEPHADTVLILIVTQESSLLPTILSRSQVVRFGPLKDEEIKAALPEASAEVIQTANGSLGFAQELIASDEIKEMVEFWKGIDGLSISEILAFTEKSKERDKASQLLEVGLKYHLSRLVSEPNASAARWVERIQEAISRLNANVNPRLALDALLLVQKEKIW